MLTNKLFASKYFRGDVILMIHQRNNANTTLSDRFRKLKNFRRAHVTRVLNKITISSNFLYTKTQHQYRIFKNRYKDFVMMQFRGGSVKNLPTRVSIYFI